MDEDQLKIALAKIDNGDRAAFREVFDHVGPYVVDQLCNHDMTATTAETAFVETFRRIWEGTCDFPLHANVSRRDWIANMALGQAVARTNGGEPVLAMDETLWQSVTQRCYPESWRNILRRLDFMGAVVCALISAVAIKILQWL